MTSTKFVVVSPAGATSGGSECLHQFGRAIARTGADISMHYLGDGPGQRKSAGWFAHYGLPVLDELIDEAGQVVVFPEVLTKATIGFTKSRCVIYWLSVDNFFRRKRVNVVRDLINTLNLRRYRLFMSQMRRFEHLSQSHYATAFLTSHGLESVFVGDYLNDDFLEQSKHSILDASHKLDQVCYNPAKGAKHIEELSRLDRSLKFVPIRNMTSSEVIECLRVSKVYIDLGMHPGKDRIPREAALMGCCVVTSKLGSAANDVDVPIDKDFKFDIGNYSDIPNLIGRLFADYSLFAKRFASYRSQIEAEKENFHNNVAAWVRQVGQ